MAVVDFLWAAVNARRRATGDRELDMLELYSWVTPKVCTPCRLLAMFTGCHPIEQWQNVTFARWYGPTDGTHHAQVLLHSTEPGPASPAPNPHLQLEALHLDPAFLNRGVNQGFSGA